MNITPVFAPSPLFVLLTMMLPGAAAFADDDAAIQGPIACQIEYWSVADQKERDDDGWLLAWKANVSGDLTGEMRWWFPASPPAPEGEYRGGKIGYYVARWEVWNGKELILAGESAGKTVISNGEDGIWDGHGIVMTAKGDLRSLIGRKTYETGTVVMPLDPSVHSTGVGMFVIY